MASKSKAATNKSKVANKKPKAPAKQEKAKVSSELPVLPGEDPWTEEEIAEVREELTEDRDKITKSLREAEASFNQLMTGSSEVTGRDPADVGSSNFERDQEMSLQQNTRDLLEQTLVALRALDDGTYGICEVCGEPIGKTRLQVFPRATMCVTCKQKAARY